MADIKLPHSHSNGCEKIINTLPDNEEFKIVSELFKLLGDSNRTKIFWILCHCEECVINLSAMMEMSSPAVSHHLKLLKASGLIVSRRDGKEVYYKAAGTSRVEALHDMLETMVAMTCPGR